MFIKTILITALALLFSSYSNAQKRVVSLGTGGISGVYYPTGGSICRIVNKPGAVHGIRCALEATDGSVSNINRVQQGLLDVGIAQSNWVYRSYNSSAVRSVSLNPAAVISSSTRDNIVQQNSVAMDADSASSLRTLLLLYREYFTLIVPSDSAIYSFDDIRGKRISIGPQGSGSHATMDELLQKKGWTLADFSQVLNLDTAEQASALCEGRIDVMIYIVAHPSAIAREATEDCESRLISVQGTGVEQLLADNSYYRWAQIPAAIYRGNNKAIDTFGVNATLFTSSALSEQTAYSLVKSVFENLPEFRSFHKAFSQLEPDVMLKGPFAAPLHKGAIRYFKEIGLM
ncbi:MAG: TAXI family TRAP transporter solute-binding subunit [Pseudomonadales bacterium]|nr:TAXI family TRAP transporter solute-binding subunit [Pseudomonadales bacterium]NRA17681.1 TAXI family TRAP transporter solute-binding subunit [Oceanospirillaceae bacterium]